MLLIGLCVPLEVRVGHLRNPLLPVSSAAWLPVGLPLTADAPAGRLRSCSRGGNASRVHGMSAAVSSLAVREELVAGLTSLLA